MFRRKERDDEIRPSTGLMKWINKFFRFVLYPFIHPKAFVVLVVIMIILAVGIPCLIYKVKFADVPDWYKVQFDRYYNEGKRAFLPIKDKAVNQYNKMLRGEAYKAANVNSKNQHDIEKYDIKPQGKRNGFIVEGAQDKKEIISEQSWENATGADVNDDKNEIKEADDETRVVNQRAEDSKNNVKVYFKRDDRLNLTYVDEPEKITGRFTVINSNEALVGNREVFLYGIYTDAKNDATQEAGAYMMSNFDGKQADCYIGAYSEKNVATAICFVEGVSVNHTLVDKGWAQNVSLY